ncbi:MAG TPA: T9SS type A sorting domain-containing protein [Leeuwenhoekiella sp.]|nr:T9SS type A sorting domain-containing protein [Leeuwenhoekiella sp.]
MKTTFFSFIFLLFGFFASGQTTYDITWKQDVNGEDASLEIQTGDTVRWIWGNGASHNVISNDNDAPDDFGSETITQEGYVYSYTFTSPGVIDYFCNVHPGTMFGTISVSDNLSVDAAENLDFKIYPNPVKDRIFFQNQSKNDDLKVVIFDVLGKIVKQDRLSPDTIRNGIEVSSLKRGIYLVQVDDGTNTFTQKLIKN